MSWRVGVSKGGRLKKKGRSTTEWLNTQLHALECKERDLRAYKRYLEQRDWGIKS